jgi:hypothetical protein
MRTLLWTTGALLLAGSAAICIFLPALIAFAIVVACAVTWTNLLEA